MSSVPVLYIGVDSSKVERYPVRFETGSAFATATHFPTAGVFPARSGCADLVSPHACPLESLENCGDIGGAPCDSMAFPC